MVLAVAEEKVASEYECPVQKAHQRTFLLAKASLSTKTWLLWNGWFSFKKGFG